MSSADPLARPARIARRIPGYTRIRRVLVPRVRGNDVLRRAAERLWLTPQPTADGSGSQITAGNLVGGVGRHTLPVVLVDARKLDGPGLGPVLDEIAELQLLTAGFRPVIIQSHPDFAAARRYGYPVELMKVLDPNDSRIDVPGPTWESLRRTYGSVILLELSATELTDAQRGMLLSLVT